MVSRNTSTGVRVPPQPGLPVAASSSAGRRRRTDAAGSAATTSAARSARDEHVDVDVDRAPGPLGAPRQGERAAEGVRRAGVRRARRGWRRSCRRASRPSTRARPQAARPNRGRRGRVAWRAGNISASANTSTNSWPRATRSSRPRADPRLQRQVCGKPAARSTRSSVSTLGVVRPDSYADSVECDVWARSASSRSVKPGSQPCRSDHQPRVHGGSITAAGIEFNTTLRASVRRTTSVFVGPARDDAFGGEGFGRLDVARGVTMLVRPPGARRGGSGSPPGRRSD